ncbi:MAG: hypothetical protein K1X91_06490, partial [Bacteriodetes bacterium]|nr:hypothetical protein [Bacteroidota bacterium]
MKELSRSVTWAYDIRPYVNVAWCGLLGCVKKEITFEIKIDTQQPPVLHSLRCGKGSQHLTPDS